MARTEAQLGALGQFADASSGAIVETSKIAVPFTTIVNRSQCTDLSKDLMPRIGIERILIQDLISVQNETGPNGEAIYGAVNDFHNIIRFGGPWQVNHDGHGSRPYGTSSTSFVEVTFYGTALNLLALILDTPITVNVDGGSFTPINYSGSGIINGRNYAPYQVISLVSGLSLALHTVKIFTGGSNSIYGFEVVNTGSNIQLPPGSVYSKGRKLTQSTLANIAFNSGFETGSLGSKGGHVLLYKRADGSTAKSVTPTDSSSLFLTNATHANEELIKFYYWREFGSARSDDFSNLSTGNAAFTLDDGCTSLVGNTVTRRTTASESLGFNSNGAFFTLTFIGTGLDILRIDDSSGGSDTYSVTVDGVSIGNLASAGSTALRVEKIASGLPYGTHNVKISRVAASTFNLNVVGFNVYAPKTPTLPAGAVAIADYFLLGTFAPNTTSGIDTVAPGVLRKYCTRELVYSGTWAYNNGGLSVGLYAGGYSVNTGTNGGYFEYVFFGTGFEHRFEFNSGRATNVTVSLQNLSSGGSLQTLNSANFPGLTTSTYGVTSKFNYSTGILDTSNGSQVPGGGLSVSGLSLGLYKVRLTNNTTSPLTIEAFDVITPVHAPKDNGPFTKQGALAVGSQGIRDLRRLPSTFVQLPNVSSWDEINGFGGSRPQTTSSTHFPVGDMQVPFFSKSGLVRIEAQTNDANGSGNTYYQIYLDGLPIFRDEITNEGIGGSNNPVSFWKVGPVSVGYHVATVMWRVSGGTGVMAAGPRFIQVQDVSQKT